MSAAPAVPALRSRAIGIIATGTILAILYFARDVLVPITLAVILSLLLSPLVRALRRLGLGATSSVIAAVLALTLAALTLDLTEAELAQLEAPYVPHAVAGHQ